MKTFRKFKNKKQKIIINANGVYLNIKDIGRVIDFTSGWTGYASLGHNNAQLLNAIKKQAKYYSHVDYNEFLDPNLEKLSKKLVKHSSNKINKVWFAGNSGSEAIEAAMKLSYQEHLSNGHENKIKFIHRSQSFHGATLHPILVSSLDILDKYKILGGKNFIQIPQHNFYANCLSKGQKCICGKNPNNCMGKFSFENKQNYLQRSLKEFEKSIILNNPDSICAFIGETQLGSLVGDVPALRGYWNGISKICKKYNIHLILDEVYCGMGRTGRMFAYQWEKIEPDFVCLGKNMTSGIIPLSAVLTKHSFENNIIKKLGRVSLGHTFQGHSLGVAGCNQLIDIIQKKKLLNKIEKLGNYMMETINYELKDNDKFLNVRGRGFSFSVEHKTNDNNSFASKIYNEMLYNHKILINSKFHRTSFLPIYLSDKKIIDRVLDKFILSFKKISSYKL